MTSLNTHNVIAEAEFDEEEALKYYFNGGFSYQEILPVLSERHKHPLSYSTLLRRLKKYDLEMYVGVCIRNWPFPIGVFQDQCKQTMIN